MDTRNNKKDIKILKDELQTRRIHTEADVIIFRRKKSHYWTKFEETTLESKKYRRTWKKMDKYRKTIEQSIWKKGYIS